MLATAVVGAGPAGLLFCIAGRLMRPEGWPIWLFDKRVAYERTHRLRIAPEPFRALARDLDDERFDALIAFLEGERFQPAVNVLEERLAALASELGIVREQLHVGPGGLAALKAHLGDRLGPGDRLTIVGADSVHSEVRDLVRGTTPSVEHTHQVVARLRLVGPDLPDALGWVEQYKMSKVLASLLDYRLNPNGFAEVDLFMTAQEHASVVALNASPRDPVPLDPPRLRTLRAPFFRAIVERAADGFGHGPCEVLLQSTFVLEHRYIERVAFDVPEGRVFLVGDAAVSLPFFRGTACLARCVHALARAHVDLLEGRPDHYDADVAAIRRAEIGVVEGRAWLVRGAREFFRVSSLLPFPMQTWLLSAPDTDPRPDTRSVGWLVNLLFAVAALGPALGGPLAAALVHPAWLGAWLVAVPIEAAGGWMYAAAHAFEGGPHRRVRAVWRWQIALLLAVGLVAAIPLGGLPGAVAALSWFVLAGPFVAGMYLFESLDRRWWERAALFD